MKIIEEKKIRHFYAGEQLVRPCRVVLAEFDDDDEDGAGMAYEVRIEHPAKNRTSRGQDAAQSPEVFRFADLDSARLHFDTYSKILDNGAEHDPEIH